MDLVKAPPVRNPTLDALRGLAACAVMIHHFTMRTDEFTLFASAQIAVDLFFCIGGYVTAKVYQQRILSGSSSCPISNRACCGSIPAMPSA